MMFLETDAILLLWALEVWRNYFLRWNLYRDGFSHPSCCSGGAGQPGKFQCLSCLWPCMFMLRTLQWALPTPAPHSLGCPQGSLRGSLCCFLHRGLWLFYFLLWSPQVLFVLLCLCVTQQAPECAHWAPQGSLISGLAASLPCRKPSNFSLELALKLIAAKSLTAVLISDLKLLDLVTPSSLGRSGFIIIVSKEGLGDY